MEKILHIDSIVVYKSKTDFARSILQNVGTL